MKTFASSAMTSSVEEPNGWACDTSVAIAALDPSHQGHAACRRALVELRPALAGHAAFETYSVLTRLPLPLRLTGEQAVAVLAEAFPTPCWLSAEEDEALYGQLGDREIVGGSVYDALVGWAARANGRRLLTRDQRARRTYRALDVSFTEVGDD